jgi:hypothetical protein
MLPPPATSIPELVNGAAGLVVVLSGLLAGAARSVAVLLRYPPKRVERATAAGFLGGAALAIAVLVTGQPWR